MHVSRNVGRSFRLKLNERENQTMKFLKKLTAVALPLFTAISMATPAVAENEEPQEKPTIPFTLNAHVEDYGEVIKQVRIDVSGLGLKAEDFDVDSFKVLATAVETEDASIVVYEDVEREVESLEFSSGWVSTPEGWKQGLNAVILNLEAHFGGAGAGTLNYRGGMNRTTNQSYKIELTKDAGELAAADAVFAQQGNYSDAETDAFSYGSLDGVQYRLFCPANENDGNLHPLILWLHGAGERGTNDAAQILANRGALGFVTPEGQEIFGGAFVLAPQSTKGWNNEERDTVINIIDYLAAKHPVDMSRLYVSGCSMGGFGTNNLVVDYPNKFAAAVPICSGTSYSDEEYKAAFDRMNVFYVVAENDSESLVNNTKHFVELIPHAEKAIYENNLIDGVDYPGHWSWIWVGRNEPKASTGESLYEWMASKSVNAATFTLKGHTFDWGEGINQVVISVPNVNFSRSDIDAETFKVLATATHPGGTAYEDAKRVIESVSAGNGTITLNLNCDFGAAGAGTLAYTGRNVVTTLSYDVQQTKPITLRNGDKVEINTFRYEQVGQWTNDEVDAFEYGSKDNVVYRFFKPANYDDGAKHPLLLWLHGAGESGNNNETQIRANRGALGWVTPEAQEIFGGAFVLAPETNSGWSDADCKSVNDLIFELAEEYNIDLDRVHVAGCSMGGGGTVRIATTYPDTFATVTPICAASNATDEKLKETLSDKEVWFIHAANDTSVNVEGSRHMHEVLPNSHYTEYPNNLIDGFDYPGHWSWIWFGNNDPKLDDGTTIFEWEANTRKNPSDAKATFELKAQVYDWGEGVNKVVIDTAELGLPAEINPEDFVVTVYGTNTSNGAAVYNGVTREVESVALEEGILTLNLVTEFGTPGAGTLAYSGRNNIIDLRYQITYVPNPAATFTQVGGFEKDGELVTTYTDDEVDQFLYGKKDNVPYRLFVPENADDGAKHPLLLWLHGAGESGQVNEAQIRANRGALGWVTPEAQNIFGGAFVLAPETAAGWNADDVASVIAIIDELEEEYAIDDNRIHVAGCSMGGGGTMRIATTYPERFATVVPICAAGTGGADDEKVVASLGEKEVWFIHAANDTTVRVDGSRRLHGLLENSYYSEYENNLVDGVDYPGHWSWIWFGNNDPVNDKGQTVFEWEAATMNSVSGTVEFELKAHVFDYGESVNQIVLKGIGTSGYQGWTADSFIVKASAYRSDTGAPVYEHVERTVTAANIVGDDLVLDLACGFGGAGEGTLVYTGLNLSTDQKYEILLKDDSTVAFSQVGNFSDDETDAFEYKSMDGVQYRLYVPENYDDGAKHPLLLWLHGAGERGTNNSSQIRANRGALGWTTPEAQEIFGGAFVVAPQSTKGWNAQELETVKNIIEYLGSIYNVDMDRLHVAGCSMGGGGTTRIATMYPDMFATIVPICAAARDTEFPDDKMVELWGDKNVWFVHSAADTTVNPDMSSRRLHKVLPKSYYTEYPTVTIGDVEYYGHWSWIEFALNMPTVGDEFTDGTGLEDGMTIFEWEAKMVNEANHEPYTGFKWEDGVLYWYEEDVKQGVEGDEKNIIDATYNVERGREIYDPETDAWYWLDANAGGAVARDKEVWMPYIFQEDLATGANPEGKWVRYDKYGRMVKGWYANDNGTYYYDLVTGAMYKGEKVINEKTYFFDELTGILQK